MTTTLIILAVSVVLFVWDRLPADVVAVGALLALYLTDTLDLGESLAGFSDPSVILIATLFVVAEGLTRSGVGAALGRLLLRFSGGSSMRMTGVLLGATATMSAVLSNTGTVALMVPIALTMARLSGVDGARLLLPIAVTANVAGSLTLISTNTNIIVSDALEGQGADPFGFFELSVVGVPLVVVAIGYAVLRNGRSTRNQAPPTAGAETPGTSPSVDELGELDEAFHLGRRLRVVEADTSLTGMTVAEIEELVPGCRILTIRRANQRDRVAELAPGRPPELAHDDVLVEAGDLLALYVRDGATEVQRVGAAIEIPGEEMIVADAFVPAELVLTPRSDLVGTTAAEAEGRAVGLRLVDVMRNFSSLSDWSTPLAPGDSVLVVGQRSSVRRLRRRGRDVVVLGRPDEIVEGPAKSSMAMALVVLAVMIGLMATSAVPASIAALIAATAMVATNVVPASDCYDAVNWRAVVFIAAYLPVGTALQKTGAAEELASALTDLAGDSPLALLAAVLIAGSVLSQVISNSAAAIVLAPVIFAAAPAAGVDPRPLAIALAVSAVTGFLTPVAGAPMLIVRQPGDYSWADYFKYGTPLLVGLLAVAMLIISVVWQL